jgi:hypothetical protein
MDIGLLIEMIHAASIFSNFRRARDDISLMREIEAGRWVFERGDGFELDVAGRSTAIAVNYSPIEL